jgi:hypothetical protein
MPSSEQYTAVAVCRPALPLGNTALAGAQDRGGTGKRRPPGSCSIDLYEEQQHDY